MIVIVAATTGVMLLVCMYTCLVAGSRMDDQLTDLYKRGWEVQNGEKRDEEKA